MGVGNPLKGDDGAGPFFIQELSRIYGQSQRTGSPPVLIDAGEVPENYVEPIIQAGPEVVMVVDACDFGGKPGEIRIFESDEISKAGFTTHTLSPAIFMGYVGRQTNARIFLLAIQPRTVEMGAGISSEVKSSISELIKILNKMEK